MTLLGIHLNSTLSGNYGDQLALIKQGAFSVGKVMISGSAAFAPENVEQLINVLVPGPNGRKTIILRTDDTLRPWSNQQHNAIDELRFEYVGRGFKDLVAKRTDVDWYLEVLNEPDHAGLSTSQTLTLLRESIALKAEFGQGISWIASLPTTIEGATACIKSGATDGYEVLGCHLYGDYNLGDGSYDWPDILALCLAQNRAVWVTEAGINDPKTPKATKAQRILDWMQAHQTSRLVGLVVFVEGQKTAWPQYEIDASMTAVFAKRATTQPAPPIEKPAPPPASPAIGGQITVNDYAGFDATVPLQVPNYARYPWTAIYVHGVNATRILPESEQAKLPDGQALLPISVPLTRCPGCRESGMTTTQGNSDGFDYAATLIKRGWQPGQLVAIDWEAGTEQAPGFASYGKAMVTALQAKGFLVAPYATPATLGALLDAGTKLDAVWLTRWTRTTQDDDVTRWWRARYPMFAWQWGGFVTNADLDLCTPQFYGRLRGAVPMEASYADFETKFRSSGGIYQAWLHNGGVVAFGSAISQEYDTTGADGKPVRRQWYERAVAEWRAGQWPANWDVTFMLLGDIIRDNGDELKHLLADKAAHQAAFVPA